MLPKPLLTACQNLNSRRLLYPSAGADFILPIKSFHPFIDEFWFVDKLYKIDSPLLDDEQFKRVKSSLSTLSGTTLKKRSRFEIQIRHDTYSHQGSNRQFVVNKCRDCGYDLFRAAFRIPNRKLSIFFYRGDSEGESGSGFYWLRRPTIKHVIEQLEPKALIVSDGSNAISRFRRFHNHPDIGEKAEKIGASFTSLF